MQHRKNRRDPDSEQHDDVWRQPEAYTRASRRDAGIRTGAHVDRMRAFYADNRVLPRAVRRLLRDPALAAKRVRTHKAKVNRLLHARGLA